MKKYKAVYIMLLLVSVLQLGAVGAYAASGTSSNFSPDSFRTPEYYRAGGLDIINAAEAYALGYTGKGVTLGMIDEATRAEHPELVGKTVSVPSFLSSGAMYIPNWAERMHGTYVGGIMMARRDAAGMHGVAFDANLLTVIHRPDYASNKNIYDIFSQRPDVRVLNNSWTFLDYAFSLTEGDKDTRANILSTALNYPSVPIIVRLAKDNQDKVIVCAAGNDGMSAPNIVAALPRYLGAEVRNWISATALNPGNISRDANGRLIVHANVASSFTSLSAGAELWSIMAPGTGIVGPYSADLEYTRLSGTSAATPHVSGAVALVQQAFPWMSGRQLADAVLTTANNSFELPKTLVRALFEGAQGWSIIRLGDAFGSWEPGKEEVKALVSEAYANDPYWLHGKTLEECLSEIDQGAYITGTMTREQVFGQGILDAGKAVRGIARLDANRMVKEDVYDVRAAWGVPGGSSGKMALETFDTRGYAAEFSNDISERSWDDKYHHPDFQTTATGTTADNAHALALQGLSVGLRKTGDGLLVLSGTNSYSGSTMVDGGALAVSRRGDGSGGVLQKSDVLVGERGLLTGDGEIKGWVINKGNVSPGAVGHVLTVGHYTQNPGAVLNIAFDAKGKHTFLSATTATLKGGALQLRPTAGFYSGMPVQLGAPVGGSVSGAFDTVNVLSSSPTLDFRLVSGSSAGAVVESQRASEAYSQYASSGNAARAGRALRDVAEMAEGDMQHMFAALDFSAPGGSTVGAALPQLTAAPYARAAQASAEANLQLGRMALARLRTAAGTSASMSAGRTGQEQPVVVEASAAQWSAFVMPFGGGSMQRQYAGVTGYNSSLAGLMGGVFRQKDSLSLSLFSAFSRRQMDMRTEAEARSTALHVGAAALWSQDSHGAGSGWQAWAQAQVGMENTDTHRSVVFADYIRQNSSFYTSFNGMAQLGGGYMWKADDVSFGPRIGLEYAINVMPALSEDSGGASRLGMDAYTRHDLRGTAGLMAAWNKDMGQGRFLRATLEAVWRQDLLPDPQALRAHFVGYSQHAFDTRMESEGRGSLGLGGGVEVNLRQDVSLSLQLEADVLRPGYSSVGGGLSLRWEF